MIDYPYELTTRTADLTTTKVLWNSVVSTPVVKYAAADAKNFYLESSMDRYEYIWFKVETIPQEFIDAYDLPPKIKNGFI